MAATLGLDIGSFLPRFASSSNRALDSEVTLLKAEIQAVEKELLDHTDTITVLKEHVGKAQKEVVLASFKLAENSRDFETEEHLHQLDARTLV